MEQVTQEKLFERVVGILGPYAKDKDALAKVSGDTKIVTDLKVNSSRLVDIILAFEDTFNIAIGDDEVRDVQTVGKAVEMIQRKVAG